MTTLTQPAAGHLRAYIETGEMLQKTLTDAGLRPMLQLHIDDDSAHIVLVLRGDPVQLRQLFVDKHITHEQVDFVPTFERVFASYKVSLFGHDIAVVVDYPQPAAQVAA